MPSDGVESTQRYAHGWNLGGEVQLITPGWLRPLACCHGIDEGHGVPVEVLVSALEPRHADTRPGLNGPQRCATSPVVGPQRVGKLFVLIETLGEHDRIDHRQPGARPEGEVGGVGGVAHEHQVVVAPGLVRHLGEVQPPRRLTTGLVDQRMHIESILKNLLQ